MAHEQNQLRTTTSSLLRWTNLEHNDLPIISLQVEGPGRRNEALGRTDDVIAPTRHGIHYRDGLGPVGQGLELQIKPRAI